MLSPCPSPCLCFPTRRKRAISQHLVSIFQSGANCLEPFPDCLPSLALEYSSSSSYASVLSTTSTWGTSKGGENETSKHKKQAEKNAACTIIPAEGVRTEELEKLPHSAWRTNKELQHSQRAKLRRTISSNSKKLSVTLFKRKAVESQQARPMITY
ncbi:hypothetical protein PS1_003170 [Malus domestica]